MRTARFPPALAPLRLGAGWAGRGGSGRWRGWGSPAQPAVCCRPPAAAQGCGGRVRLCPAPAARAPEPGPAPGRDGPPRARTAWPPRCDCFHVMLPTWPGAPGSGAPPPRLQPAPLGAGGAPAGARRAGPGEPVRARAAAPGRVWGRLRDRPAVSSVSAPGLLDPASLLPSLPLLPVPVRRPLPSISAAHFVPGSPTLPHLCRSSPL